MFQLHQKYLLVDRNICDIIRTKIFSSHKDFYNHWNSPGLNYKSWGKNLGKLMNCLLPTLYAIWKKTPNPPQIRMIIVIIICWFIVVASGHCSSDPATLVLDTLHPQREGWALLESLLGLNRPDRQSVGRGKLSSRRECAIAWVAHTLGCAPQPPSQPSVLQTTLPRWGNSLVSCVMFLAHLLICHIYACLMKVLGQILPCFPVLLLPVALIAKGYGPPGTKACVGGVGRGHNRGRWWMQPWDRRESFFLSV